MELINHLIKYYEDEYNQAVTAIESKYLSKVFKPSEVVDNAIDRCLGVALFVQYLGMDYKDSNKEYEKIKEKLEKLLDKPTKA